MKYRVSVSKTTVCYSVLAASIMMAEFVSGQNSPTKRPRNTIQPIPPETDSGGIIAPSSAAADLFWRTDGMAGTWTGTNWSNPATAAGGTAWTSGNDAFFTANSLVTFATTAVSDVTLSDGFTVAVTAGGTLTLGGVRTFDIGTGSTLTWGSQTQSTAASNEGAGIIKNGAGILNLNAGPGTNVRYDGGFTLNAGTVIVSGNNGLSSGVMTFNGGTLQTSGGLTFTSSSVVIGGNFAFAGTGNDVWNQAVSLGSSNRTITNNTTGTATRTFSNAISSTGGGLVFAGSGGSGGIVLGIANSYSGGTVISGGKLVATADGALSSGNVSLTASSVTLTLQNGATNNYISNNSSISIVNGAVANLNFSGAHDLVGGIVLNGVTQTNSGTYGGAGSGANFQSAFFSGTGLLELDLIPEPSTWAMICAGAILLCGAQRFRRKHS